MATAYLWWRSATKDNETSATVWSERKTRSSKWPSIWWVVTVKSSSTYTNRTSGIDLTTGTSVPSIDSIQNNSSNWNPSTKRFLNETRALEIRLVHDLEDAVGRCRTLWSIYEVLCSFKHLYDRPLFTAVINSSANQVEGHHPDVIGMAWRIFHPFNMFLPLCSYLRKHRGKLKSRAESVPTIRGVLQSAPR